MGIKARRLEASEIPERVSLYEVGESREIVVEEEHSDDDSRDQVTMEYCIEGNTVGYFAHEYRPADVPKEGAKIIDITAVMLNHVEKYVRWHLYDVKATLAGAKTVVKLYNQWNAGLQYLQKDILDQIPEYEAIPDLGVIARTYDEQRMLRLSNDYQKHCHEIENNYQALSLAQRKKRPDIAKYKGVLKAAQAILDGEFQAEDGTGTYRIHIRLLSKETDLFYKTR